jgi:hypothetical protein
MKTVGCFNDLWHHGIRCLTGESCRLGARLLCDLTPRGVATLCDFMGLHYERGKNAFCEPWNGSGAVASVMLTRDMVPMLGVWALLNDPACVGDVYLVTEKNGSRYALRGQAGDKAGEMDIYVDWSAKDGGFARVFRVATSQPGAGTRNEHAMTGRLS